MLAQLNSKQKSLFFNIKPTVIDKLISKNKSSIQNNLVCANEDSDGSLSDDSDESSSSQDSSLVISTQHPSAMAPMRRSEKILGSKLSSRSAFPIKRGSGRSTNQIKRGKPSSALKVVAAKKVVENSKRGTPNKVVTDVKSVVKVKKNARESLPPSTVKRSRSLIKNENRSSVSVSENITGNESLKTTSVGRSSKVLKDKKPLTTTKNKSPHKTPLGPQTSTLPTLDTKSSPRKFPSNIIDRWKSTGMVIRGRGRPRGSLSRGSLRGGIRRFAMRSERYNTRESQTGLMRSGKKRKCSDSNVVEGLEWSKRKRKVIKRVKREKNDCPSDEHSSFVTTSELSFYDNDNSLKQSDDEIISSRLVKVKDEVEETEDETTHSRDTNSNVFKSDQKVKTMKTSSSGSDVNDQTNDSKLQRHCVRNSGPKRLGRGRKRLIFMENKTVSQSDSSVRDSDCSLDSDLTEDLTNSPKQGLKRHRRKGVDGLWVRRSTRSVGKNLDKAVPDAVVIEEILKEKDFTVDLGLDSSNSKSSLHFDSTGTTNGDLSVRLTSSVDSKLMEENYSTVATLEMPIEETRADLKFDCDSDKISTIPDIEKIIEQNLKVDENSDNSTVENDSLVDFTLSLEETPVKNCVDSLPAKISEIALELNFDSEKREEMSSYDEMESKLTSCVNQGTNLDLEDKNLSSFSNCKSNNINNLLDDKCDSVTDICLINQKIYKESNIVTSNKDETINLVLFNTVDDKETVQNSDVELISDEKILSLNDSFCQSDSTDAVPERQVEQPPTTALSDDDSDKAILNSIHEITSEVESKLLKETVHEDLSNKINTHDGEAGNSLVYQEMHSESITSSPMTGENTICIPDAEENEEESVANMHNELSSKPSDGSESHDVRNCYENSMKIDDLDKATESTEESSSSDSNSNLSELMSTPLENDSMSLTMKINPSDNVVISEILKVEQTIVGDEIIGKEGKTCAQSLHESLSLIINSESNNKTEETYKENVSTQSKPLAKSTIPASTAERPSKELLSALGLKPSLSVPEEKPKRPFDSYTGTLKAVIKLNRSSDKRSGGRKMIFKQGDKMAEDSGGGGDRLEYRICSAEELSTEGVPLTHLADIPANRKTQMKVKNQFDLSNSPNIVGSAGSMETPTDSTKEGGKQNLIIPEKSSSFSIHPERLCTDVCSYCFGKFGSLDTPCHLAQLKNSERQAKILAIEVHLSADSCLCDGCFRYVDRKANCPASQRSRKPAARRGPLAGTICTVQECTQPARHSVRRKWLIKLKKSIGKKLVIDMDKNPHLPFPLCSQHYYWVDYFTVCGICKKRLTRNHMYALGPEAGELNQALSDDGIPVRLSDKLFLCKLCRYYSSLRLKYRDPSAMSSTHRLFLNSYRKKILHYHDIPVSESEEEVKSVEDEGSTSEVSKVKKRKSKSKSIDGHESKKRSTDKEEKSDPGNEDQSNDSQMIDYSYLDTLNVHREEPSAPTVDYSSLGDFEGQVGFSNIASFLNPLEGGQGTVYNNPSDSQNRSRAEKPTRIQVKFGNLNIGKLSNLNIGQDTRPSSSATPALERPPYLPGERDLNLSGEFEFRGSLNPSSSWERCTSTIQFDRDTKKLWQELQRPYGNQSSFLRHLVILEKHWRNGSLVLAENPNPRAVKYINSVRNRVQAYDGAKSTDVVAEKPKLPEVIVTSPPPRPLSTPIKTMSAPPPLMKIAPGSTPWLQDQLRRPPPYNYSTTLTPTNSRIVPIVAPPPYRFPPRPNQIGSHPVRMPNPSPTFTNISRSQQNVRPLSISYQQFKKIRLEKPPSTVSQVTVVPKIEPPTEMQCTSTTTTSSANDFVPLICDVRSLATTTSDWNESFRKQQHKLLKQNVAKYYTPILPKIPNSLTVTTFPQTTALVMKTSSLTIEKAPNNSTKPNVAPPEKPSISVFRETTPSENG